MALKVLCYLGIQATLEDHYFRRFQLDLEPQPGQMTLDHQLHLDCPYFLLILWLLVDQKPQMILLDQVNPGVLVIL